MIFGILIGFLAGTIATISTMVIVDRYIKMQCEEDRWAEYLEEMANEQRNKNTNTK